MVDFLLRLRSDQCGGTPRPLHEYLALYPEHQDEVAREYLLVRALDQQQVSQDPDAFGAFRLLRQLGTGGQGTVWLAYEPLLARQVALKLLHRAPVDELAEARFLRAAGTAVRFDHPNLCRVLGAGREGQTLWVAMQYLPGPSLQALLQQWQHDGAWPGLQAAARWLAGLARGVAHAHALGVVHRDIKPANVLLDGAGQMVLTDFGLAREQSEEQQRLTRTGNLHGTPAWLAPELLRGDEPTAAADVWALGLLLYQMCGRRQPFAGPSVAATTRNILDVEVWSVPGFATLPADLRAVLAMALHKEPRHRYAGAADLAADLENLADGRPVAARPPRLLRRVAAWARHEPALAASLALVGTLLVAGLLLALQFLDRERGLRQAAQVATERTRTVACSILNDLHEQLADVPGVVAARLFMLQRARDALQELHALAPGDLQVRHELIQALIKLGAVLGMPGVGNVRDDAGAAAAFAAAARLAREGMQVAHDRFAADLGQVLENEGSRLLVGGGDAGPVLRESIDLLAAAVGPDRCRPHGARTSLAQVESRAGNHAEALAQILQAEAEIVADTSLGPVEQLTRIGCVRTVRGQILEQSGEPEAAVALLQTTVADLAAATAKHPGNDTLQWRLGRATGELGRVLLAGGDLEQGLQVIDEAVRLARKRCEADQANRAAGCDLAWALGTRATYRQQAGDPRGALVDAREALALAEAGADHRQIPLLKALLARLPQ